MLLKYIFSQGASLNRMTSFLLFFHTDPDLFQTKKKYQKKLLNPTLTKYLEQHDKNHSVLPKKKLCSRLIFPFV